MSLFTSTDLSAFGHLSFPDLDIPERTVCFLSGPSGCGKSTLFRLMNGVLSPSGGQLRFRGENVEKIDPIRLRRQVMLAGQAVYLFDDTIAGNFRQFYGFLDLPAPKEIHMKKYLDLCCAPFLLHDDCAILSGGQRQRVFLAIVLSMGSPVLLLDEPTAALDRQTASHLFSQITAHCRQNRISLLVICHDHGLSQDFAQMTVSLDVGIKELQKEGCP